MVVATAKAALDIHCTKCHDAVVHVNAGETVQVMKATLQDSSEIAIHTVSDIPQNPKGIMIHTHDTNAYLCGCCYTDYLEDIRNAN